MTAAFQVDVTGLDVGSILLLIPSAPLLASLFIFTFGRLLPRATCHLVAGTALSLSLLMSLVVLFQELPAASPEANYGPELLVHLWDWIDVGSVQANITLRVDAISAIMLAMVTGISLLVVVFASGYMHGDAGYPRFFAAVCLFVFSMCMLVMASSFLMLFVFWEGVGLCSYLLIGFWYEKRAAAAAAKKAFVVNRIGDLGLILGMFLIWNNFGSLNFAATLGNSDRIASLMVHQPQLFILITGLLFLGAMGKSAQFPLHVWLPDAMEGPTPVSALIHAATMVTAGVYLVARCTPFFICAPSVQVFVAIVGATTALISALIALTQTDLKRIMAYSTVSQLGYMFMALGAAVAGEEFAVFAVTSAMFHLFTHAFFKALLFLASGSVMHSMGNIIDMRHFGGLSRVLPATHKTFLCGAAALSGVPLLSGFWSKDDVLASLYNASLNGQFQACFKGIFLAAVITSALTAYYTFRAYFLTFHGETRFPEEAGEHPHDAPLVMAAPLVLLAVCSVGIGFLVGPCTHWFVDTIGLGPTLRSTSRHEMHLSLMLLSTVTSLIGVLVAYTMFGRNGAKRRLSDIRNTIGNLSYNKFYVDELLLGFVVLPLRGIGKLAFAIDQILIDPLIDFLATLPRLLSVSLRGIHSGATSSYAAVMYGGFVVITAFALRVLFG